MKDQIESRIGLTAFDIYGLTEICGPGVGCSCQYCEDQIHINSDMFWPEIVDPETGKVLPEGELGELVFSSILKEGVPMIRYNTHDLTRIHYGKCACGRTTPRIDKITGRADDMLIIRGVNVFPTQIETAVMRYKEVLPHYMIYVDRINNLDVISVKIELNPASFPDTMKGLEKLTKSIEGDIASITGIHAKVQLVEPRSLPRSEGKMVRVIDSRFKK
jgi:phenylacetate-CoA ligase